MANQDQINAAIEAYRRGSMAEAGNNIGVQQGSDEADPDFNARLRGLLNLPDWVPTPTPLPGMTGTTEETESAKPAPEPAPEPEDNPEPEDEEGPHGRRRTRR